MPGEIKRKLSQEEKRFANIAKRFIRQAGIGTKNCRMFGETHPVVTNNLRNVHELLKGTLAGRESATFTFLEGALLVEDIPLKDIDPKVYSFIPELKECGITSLTFQAGVNEGELTVLLKIVSSGPIYIKDGGGVINILHKKDASHIKVDETYFKRVSKKDEESATAKTELADMLIVDYLLGKKDLPKDKLGALTKALSQDPGRISSALSKAASSGGASQGKTQKGAGAFDIAEFTCLNINRLAGEIKSSGGKKDTLKKGIGEVILGLDPSLRSKVLKSDAETYATSGVIQNAVSGFSDEIVLNIIVSDFVDNKSSVVETRKLIERLLPDAARRTKALPLLEKKLLKKGISQDVCSQLIEGKFWSDMTDEEKTKNIESHDPQYCADLGVAGVIRELIVNLLGEKKFDMVRVIVEKALGNLSSSNMDLKVRFIRDFKHVAILLLESAGYPYKKELLRGVTSGAKASQEAEMKKRFANLSISLIKVCLQNKYYNHLPELMRISGYDTIKDTAFRETSLGTLLDNILSSKNPDNEAVKDIVAVIGKDAELALCEALIGIEGDSFEAYKKRHVIAMILKSSGVKAENCFIEKLSSDKVATLKNALEALSEIGTEKSASPVEKLMSHKFGEIKKRAEVALRNIKKRSSS